MVIFSSLKQKISKIVWRVVPVALLVALWGSSANASNLPSSVKTGPAELKRPEKRLVLTMAPSAEINKVDMGHTSHSSHVSHHSHHSHHSHYSG